MALPNPILKRKINLLQATSINMIDMAGIGPFVVLYLVIQISGGPHFLYAWFVGAFLSLMDALIWSELGAAYPLAGGSYNFLKVAYGEEKWGQLFSFLYVWQTMIQAPLVMASAAIGFTEYLNFFIPLGFWASKIIAGSVIILVVISLYRKIEEIGKLSIILWTSMIIIFSWIIGLGISHGKMLDPLSHINDNLVINQLFFVALGQASVKTIYTYLGYYNVCQLGSEIVNPGKNIPRSMLISVAGITLLYIATNLSVTSIIPWQTAMKNKYIISELIKTTQGIHAANIATVIILLVAFASLFSATLGYSRVPYAAAKDGAFFSVFAKLHPTKNFPYISLLFLGAIAFIFSMLFKMKHVIDGILAMRILIQFIAQAIGVVLLRKRVGTKNLPFKMWLYPLPVILSVLIWLYVFFSTGMAAFLAILLITAGTLVFYLAQHWWKKNPAV
ncbi:MAG TPA: amino acid permease [Puia sp.]|nr:amino acid permease [Puia sp.]